LAPVTGPVGWVVLAIPLSPLPDARDVVGVVVLVVIIVVEHRERGKSNGVLSEVSDSGQDRARPGNCGSGAIHAERQRCRRLGAWLGKPATLPLGRARTLPHPPCRKGSWTPGATPGRSLAPTRPPMMRLLPSAVLMARPCSLAVATLTSLSSSSILRCAPVGITALATALVPSDTAPMRSLAAFPGAVLLADDILPAGAGPPMMRSLPSTVLMARPRLMAVVTSTSSSSSSIVRCVAVDIPALATARVSSDAAPRHS
jgi:hypothetical protein